MAPDATTVDYLRRAPFAPRASSGRRRWRLGVLPTDPGAVFDREVERAGGEHRAAWSPGGRALGLSSPIDRGSALSGCLRRPRATRGLARALAYMGLAPGTPICRGHVDTRLHRLVHQQPARGSAGRGPGARVAQGAAACARPGRAGLRGSSEQAGGSRGARSRCSPRRVSSGGRPAVHVRGDQRRDRAARAARGLHLQPQLRGTPGPGRAHPFMSPAMAAAAAVTGRSPTCAQLGG